MSDAFRVNTNIRRQKKESGNSRASSTASTRASAVSGADALVDAAAAASSEHFSVTQAPMRGSTANVPMPVPPANTHVPNTDALMFTTTTLAPGRRPPPPDNDDDEYDGRF